MEEWKDIEGYEGMYQVSNLGRVRSFKKYREGRILKSFPDPNGYLKVSLSKNNKLKNHRVHRLVAIHFIPNPQNKSQVNHIDGNKQNDNVNNLEWSTPSENGKHAYKIGLSKGRLNSKPTQQTRNKISKSRKGKCAGTDHFGCRKIICITTGEMFDCIEYAVKKYKIPNTNIIKCCKGERKSAGKHPITKEKMIWKYIE